MSAKKDFKPKDIVKSFKEEFKGKILESRIEKHVRGLKKNEIFHVWIKIDREIIKDFVKHLKKFEKYPHFAVSSGYDMGDTIDLVYHFAVGFGERGKEISINVTMSLPKSDPTIDTITDIIPGALISEQEKQEMLGVIVKNIPKNERVFIPNEFPEGVYPWRKDEKGPDKYINNLHEVKK